jgi:hypothetical protein
VVKKTVIENVRQYEKVRHVRVTIDNTPGGVKSLKGCVDPIAKGWIESGAMFSNTGGVTQWRFPDKWVAGQRICHPHRVVIDGQAWWQGDKDNCNNKNIRIPIGPAKFTKYVPVVRFISTKTFTSTFEKWASSQNKSTSTSTTTTTYSCNPGWTLVNGNQCQNCPPTPCPTFTATGSTNVQSQKPASAACPAPNQGIVKTAASDVFSLTSPTFTGRGTTQDAANQDLVAQENAWKTSNQSTVDNQALAQAQARLNTALQSCPSTPPPPPTPVMDVKNVTSPEEVNNDGETYPNLFADAYTPNGDSITCVIGVTNPNDHTQSGFGSIVGQRSFTFVSHGYDRVGPYTYQAPTDATAVGKNDQLEVTCHDNSNVNVKNASGFSQPFPVIATKPSP